jgi:hypothetical protein
MTRGEWVTLALTLVGSGGTYFLTGRPMWAGAALVGGLGILAILFLKGGRRGVVESPPTITDSLKQSIENVGNPHIEAHIHLPETATPPAPLPVSTATKPQREGAKPNIHFVRTRSIRVTPSGPHGNNLVEAIREIDSRNPQAAVAYFRNSASESIEVPNAYGVHAQILYKDAHGNEIDDVPNGHWLDPFKDSAIIQLNDTRGLILMLMIEGKELRAPYQDRYKGFRIGQISTIEVCLTSTNAVLLRERFELMDDNGSLDAFRLP